jgi:hypothetical protein
VDLVFCESNCEQNGRKILDTLQKHQSPSTKSQTISKFQFPMSGGFVSDFGSLGNWKLFGIWDLDFGIWLRL